MREGEGQRRAAEAGAGRKDRQHMGRGREGGDGGGGRGKEEVEGGWGSGREESRVGDRGTAEVRE